MESGLPIYMLVIGAEGAGHHALQEVWETLSNYYDTSIITYDGIFHVINVPHSRSQSITGFSLSTSDINKQHSAVQEYFSRDRVRGKQLVIDSQNSYPAGFGVGSLAHPDVVHLMRFDGELYDLRVLIITRSLPAASISAVNRFYDLIGSQHYKNHHFQCRATQKVMTLVSNSVSLMPCNKVAFLSYELITTNKSSVIPTIAQLLHVAEDFVAEGFKRIHSSSKLTSWKLNKTQIDNVIDFFDENAKFLPMLSPNHNIPKAAQTFLHSPRIFRTDSKIAVSTHTYLY